MVNGKECLGDRGGAACSDCWWSGKSCSRWSSQFLTMGDGSCPACQRVTFVFANIRGMTGSGGCQSRGCPGTEAYSSNCSGCGDRNYCLVCHGLHYSPGAAATYDVERDNESWYNKMIRAKDALMRGHSKSAQCRCLQKLRETEAVRVREIGMRRQMLRGLGRDDTLYPLHRSCGDEKEEEVPERDFTDEIRERAALPVVSGLGVPLDA